MSEDILLEDWTRESGPQPGVMLEVISLNTGTLNTVRY